MNDIRNHRLTNGMASDDFATTWIEKLSRIGVRKPPLDSLFLASVYNLIAWTRFKATKNCAAILRR